MRNLFLMFLQVLKIISLNGFISNLLIHMSQVDMMETHLKTKEMVRDMLALIGQADIAVWEARELAMYPKLNRDFVDTLKNLNRRKGGASTRFSANKLFHEDLDSVVARKAKEAKMDKILARRSDQFNRGNRYQQNWADSR